MEIGLNQPALTDAMGKQVLGEIKVSQRYPMMTSIAKFNPSPDWFSGLFSFDLRQQTDDPSHPLQWYKAFTIETFPWTAGTMTGGSYNDSGAERNPRRRISRFTVPNPPASGAFLNEGRTIVHPVARWSCELMMRTSTSSRGETTTTYFRGNGDLDFP